MLADPGLTARVLRLANSSFYGFRAKVETITRAVTLLGRQQIHDVVLATSVARAFTDVDIEMMDVSRFWRESIYTALVSRIVAKLCNVLDSERLFVHGLLCDLGHLIMYQKIPELARQALTVSQTDARLITHVEQELGRLVGEATTVDCLTEVAPATGHIGCIGRHATQAPHQRGEGHDQRRRRRRREPRGARCQSRKRSQ